MQSAIKTPSVLEGRERILIAAPDRIVIRRPYRTPCGVVRVMETSVRVDLKPGARLFVGKEFPRDVARRAFGAG